LAADIGTETPATVDATETWVPAETTGETLPYCQPGTGCFLDPCDEPSDCLSNVCIEHMGDGVCSMECVEECPQGFECRPMPGPDMVFMCVSPFTHLCRPCLAAGDCMSATGVEDACLDFGPEGLFCGANCDSSLDCPNGFTCELASTVAGASVMQCVPDSGICFCSKKAKDLGLGTSCAIQNEFGVCNGTRVCAEDGLTPCDAQTPAAEVCDGLDNDCNGDVDDVSCDDGNDCTQDSCDPAAGCVNAPLTGTECSDGNICSLADHCQSGECVGSLITCDDDNPCTDDSCNPLGGCQYVDNLVPCDDEDPCTVKDSCVSGACSGYAVPCDCAVDADCDKLEDGDVCNGTLVCDASKLPFTCAVDPLTVVACPGPEGVDAQCLDASCDPETGECSLVPANESGICNDGDACTLFDQCTAGVCAGLASMACDDGNPCTKDTCDGQSGCSYQHNTDPCDDGNACTIGDVCSLGACVGSGVLACDDGDVCTTDSCAPGAGCLHDHNTLPCNDGNACTIGDGCDNGACIGVGLLQCDDGNPCTDDWCDPVSGCAVKPNTKPCDDNNTCTTDDACSQGKCVGKGSLECDDGNPCTKDICLPLGGCDHVQANGFCSDSDPCTVGDTCANGACQPGAPINCDDGNLCTDDYCAADGSCVHSPNSAPCDDGSACTTNDVCQGGMCTHLTMVNCDDKNPCTTDSCSPVKGCSYATNNAMCDDKNACTALDVCKDGSCTGTAPLNCNDGNPCTTDSCLPESGCVNQNNTLPCFDGDVCTTGDTCFKGSCLPTGMLACDDKNPCTDDVCDKQVGCVHTPNTAPCDDKNACTVDDVCSAGGCFGTTPPDCSDGNICTTDGCLPATGCVHTFNTESCDDGNTCTVGDACKDGACTPGAPLLCNDGNACTDDSCNPAKGCLFTPNAAACSDGDACTVGEACADGSCKGGSKLPCNDQNVCTADSCNSATGCVFTPAPGPCDDGSKCTTGETCSDGSCGSGAPLNCNDNNACTADSCNPATGCVHTPAPCCGNGVKDAGEACDDGNQVGGDGCSADCTKVEYSHNNGQGVVWFNDVPTGTMTSEQAKLSCEKTFGNCCYSGGDCAGPGWCQGCSSGKCWGWTAGCSGGAGRVWQYSSSYTTYGYWN
jgi:cysteine-rich repeat protein